MAKQYGVGILGAGWVAPEYVKPFRDHSLTEVVGIYNRTPGKATELLHAHGIQPKEYASLDDFFRDDRIQIVVSATPPTVRREHCVRAAQTGAHVVSQRPVGLVRAHRERRRGRVGKGRVQAVARFVLRWNPQFETVGQMIKDGVLGDLIYAEGDYWHPLKKRYPGY